MAIESRTQDDLRLFSQILDHGPTRISVEWEREFLKTVGGGCSTPLGALAEIKAEGLEVRVFWAQENGAHAKRLKSFCKDTSLKDSFIQDLARQVKS